MLFKKEHRDMILDRKKTATRRMWKKPRVKLGGIYKAKLKMLSSDYFAKIKITRLYKQQLGEMTEEDVIKEGYSDITSFHNKWIEINGHWDNNQEPYVVEFEVVK